MKVLITPRGFANYGLDKVRYMESKGLEVHYNNTGKAYTKEEFYNLASDADAIIVGVDIIDKELIDKCPNLKVVCKFGVGTDNIDVDYAKEKGIFVGRTVGSNSKAVAEHVVALMFADAKNLYNTAKEVKNHKWNKPTGQEISGKTLGIIGFGMIGKHIANFANGLGMKVYAYDAFEITDETAKEFNVEKKSFEEIISESDYVSLHVPLLESTKNMLSTEEFKKMKNDACLINAARGGIVDEEALYEALINKEIRSAYFDVYSTEPPTEDDKLLALDNFVLTPHTAARTIESEKRTCEMSTEIILQNLLG
ncbi:phosphoglycerate dehydrogenase [Clostridium intestinale]|uniref:D-isomer specific 2-hydroxyacid dehydrogenase NAD-binding protein n=1 Tax=Clostridium intestinale URNW TaxID=1294142 RepID=U2NKL4_9CLOT|nr:phosphoglycerate dehydrogenase [Clostridium intestinale]ERK29416.1 D-isomer specific 2-hydroxyacid dehydrogenase NAD-binding protein [Clostridium intestinale URNW]